MPVIDLDRPPAHRIQKRCSKCGAVAERVTLGEFDPKGFENELRDAGWLKTWSKLWICPKCRPKL